MDTSTLTTQQDCTAKDYALLSENAPYQLIQGRLIMTPAPTPRHQRVSKQLEWLLCQFAEKGQKLGEVFDAPIDIHLSEKQIYQPDLIFISQERRGIIGEMKIEGAPDLVVEILSPGTAYYDLRTKKKAYAQYGVKEYWIVDPLEKSVEIFENRAGEFVLHSTATEQGQVQSKLLVGFAVSMEEIF